MAKLTFYGHACFSVELDDGTRLLFDPFISPNPLASEIDISSISADYILLTHGHEDHLADAETLLKQTGAQLISNYEIVTWYGAKGISHAHPMNHGGAFDFPFGRVKYVNAIHSSSFPDGSYAGNPGGFIIESPASIFYVSGDTALHADQQQIGQSHKLDFAVLCIGDNFTMGPHDAAIAAEWIRTKRVVGCHYDTFPPIEIDHDAARDAFKQHKIELLLPGIGETIDL